MRMTSHTVKEPTWTTSDYGEPIATYDNPHSVLMRIGWTYSSENRENNQLYEEYEFVAITKEKVVAGSLIDDKYVVGHIETSGRFIRLFMNYAEGVER